MGSPKIGLALSGGGFRAVAFHLGCLRALHNRGILEKVSVLSGVSGGSIVAALYAYNDKSFEEFEAQIEIVLSKGMVRGIVLQTFCSSETPKILLALVLAGFASLVGRTLRLIGFLLSVVGFKSTSLQKLTRGVLDLLPRFASRTTAFERYLMREYFGNSSVDAVARKNLAVVLNAAELRTETAFRFGSTESGCWRFGRLVRTPSVATAVAASAAFPALLPAIDRRLEFQTQNAKSVHRVIITDGGVYDNLGITCMLPGRSSEFSTNALPVDFIIACDAGAGMPTGARRPYFWPTRMMATVATIHRRTQSMSQDLLHRMSASGEIDGFLMPYLGQIDSRLPNKPPNFVTREETFDYPTNFNSMLKGDIQKLSGRGEQLTSWLVDAYGRHL